jgi:thioesterase DpgC
MALNEHQAAPTLIKELQTADLPPAAVQEWLQLRPPGLSNFTADCRTFCAFWTRTYKLLAQLPKPALRQQIHRAAARRILDNAREMRVLFLNKYAEELYDALTQGRSQFLSLDTLVARAAEKFPGLVPGDDTLAAENGCLQRDKAGLEIDQGLFISAVLRSESAGRHLCHAALLPRPEAQKLLPKFTRDGIIRLPGASIERRGKAAVVSFENPRFLNAEDQTTLDSMETCVDLALLDPATEIGVLRGGTVEHPKYKGRRVFGSGINLTHLYHGRIPFLWYLQRDLGYVNKLYRGLASADDNPPDEFGGLTREKPWIAAVESFAIGGHCQVLLAVDYVLAEQSAYMTLPARKEGIIPGAANMRLPRAVGDRIARQAIQYERRLPCDSPEGRLICDEIVPDGTMDAAIDGVVEKLTGSGVVSAAANRRAIRVAQEPLDMFRNYFAVYAREQAYCHFSPALISNLETSWNAQHRKP